MTHPEHPALPIEPPGRPPEWSVPLLELDRWEWRATDGDDPLGSLDAFLTEHGVGECRRDARPVDAADDAVAVVLLAGGEGAAGLAGLPGGKATPLPAVPDVVAVAVRRGGASSTRHPVPPGRIVAAGDWRTTWSDVEHADAVEQVRRQIARGQVYQVNVVGHRCARHRSTPSAVAAAVATLPGATYGGAISGAGWSVGCASPEQLVRVEQGRVTTVPVKGTRVDGPGAAEALRRSEKDRAEHVMIVDLERNDLSRVARTGTVEVEELYALSEWSGLWHAGSRVAAELADGVRAVDLLAALLPGGSVTGAPKRAACALIADLEPVGRGPAMGAFGMVRAGGLDLGLTIRTVGADDDTVHLWAGGGVTWDSDPVEEVAEAHAKAGPLLRVLAGR
jgi:para-aminobenzoate synthetase component I